MLHQLFTLEHNAIADRLKSRYPDKDDQWLYDKACLINSALMAKIHTVEWTPAVIANPITERAMYSNWWGLLGQGGPRTDFQNEVRGLREDLAKKDSFVKRILGFDPNLSGNVGSGSIDHALTGIVGSAAPNNYGVPFALSEEFVAVYRMHPLMRDNIEVYDIGSNVASRTIPLQSALASRFSASRSRALCSGMVREATFEPMSYTSVLSRIRGCMRYTAASSADRADGH